MGHFTISNQGTNTYLEYELDSVQKIDTLCMGMLKNNKIQGMLPVSFHQMDQKKFIKYTISSKITLDKLLTGEVNRQELLTILQSILEAIMECEEYMIPYAACLLEENKIYVEVSTGKAYLICLPVLDRIQETEDIRGFFKNIVFGAKYNQKEDNSYVAQLINSLNEGDVFSITSFKNVVDTLLRNRETKQTEQPMPPAGTDSEEKHTPPVHDVTHAAVADNVMGNTTTNAAGNVLGNIIGNIAGNIVGNDREISKKENDMGMAIPGDNMGMAIPGNDGGMAIPGNNGGMAIPGADMTVQEDAGEKNKKRKLFDGLFKKKTNSENDSAASQQTPAVQGNYIPNMAQGNQTQASAKKDVMIPADFGGTTVLKNVDYNATTVLGQHDMNEKGEPYLIRKRNQEMIRINKPVFRIGRANQYADYCVNDNGAVGHSHADIMQRDNGYVIVDNNTRNGTKLDGRFIVSNTEELLSDGMEITLANEAFEYHEW